MEVKLPRGKYILAVSGGVDSMVLMDILADKPGIDLIVAHFNHNIRKDSGLDEKLVGDTAAKYGLVFEVGSSKLGKSASEEVARKARYLFLEDLAAKYQADKIITAHHQDDLIETALINLIRGTGRQGLSSITNNSRILRPLLSTPKQKVLDYAQARKLEWREDSSNQNEGYLRNYLRNKVLTKMTSIERDELIINLDKVAKMNIKIDNQIATISQFIGNKQINRQMFSELPPSLGSELVAYWLRDANIKDYDSKTVNRLNMAIRTSKANSKHPIKQGHYLKISKETATLVTP